MSKTFDEGGAKGLLLANLGVGYSGCSIVFDSTLDNDNIAASFIATNDKVNVFNPGNGQTDKDGAPSDINVVRDSNFAIQVTGLICKLESLLSDSSRSNSTIENMPLVPQLSSLRNQYADLGKDGFVEEVGISVRMTNNQKWLINLFSRYIPSLTFCDSFSQNAMLAVTKMRLRPTNPSTLRRLNVVESLKQI